MNERRQYISTTTLVILFAAVVFLFGLQLATSALLNEALKMVTDMQNELKLIEAQQKQVKKLYNEVNQIREYIQLRRPRTTGKEAWETAAYIVHFSRKYDTDPWIVAAMAAQESNFDRNALGSSGERGIMQVLPDTFRGYGHGDIRDWRASLEAGIRYYKYLERRYGGNVPLTVAAYNAGPGRVVDRIPEIKSTQYHVRKVMLAYRGMRGRR